MFIWLFRLLPLVFPQKNQRKNSKIYVSRTSYGIDLLTDKMAQMCHCELTQENSYFFAEKSQCVSHVLLQILSKFICECAHHGHWTRSCLSDLFSSIASHISSHRINRAKIHSFYVWKSERHTFIWTVAKRRCDIKRNHIKIFSNSFLCCDDKFTVKFVCERTFFVENVKILIEITMRMKKFDSRECSTGHEKPVLNNSSQK